MGPKDKAAAVADLEQKIEGSLKETGGNRMNLQGHKVEHCPIGYEYCYPSCYFRRDGKCQYKKIAREMRGKVPLNPTRR